MPDGVEILVGDILEMRKAHPCGSHTWKVLRIGMDFRLSCEGCGRQLMVPRQKALKSTRRIIRNDTVIHM